MIKIDWQNFMRDREWFGYKYVIYKNSEWRTRGLEDEWVYRLEKGLHYRRSTLKKFAHFWPFRWWMMGRLNKWF